MHTRRELTTPYIGTNFKQSTTTATFHTFRNIIIKLNTFYLAHKLDHLISTVRGRPIQYQKPFGAPRCSHLYYLIIFLPAYLSTHLYAPTNKIFIFRVSVYGNFNMPILPSITFFLDYHDNNTTANHNINKTFTLYMRYYTEFQNVAKCRNKGVATIFTTCRLSVIPRLFSHWTLYQIS